MFAAKNQQSLLLRIKRYIYRHPAGCLVFLFLLSFGLKIFACKADPLLSRDAALYCLMAQEWYKTGSYQEMLKAFPGAERLPPGFLWCLKSLIKTDWPVQTVGLIFNIICGLLLIPIGYGRAWEIFRNKKITLITAAFFAVLPSVNQLSIEIQRDIPGLCLTGAVLWSALAGIRRKNWILWNISALLTSVNFLFRYESLECIPIIEIILIYLVIKRKFPLAKAIFFSSMWFVLFALSFVIFVCGTKNEILFTAYNQYFLKHVHLVKKDLHKVLFQEEKSK